MKKHEAKSEMEIGSVEKDESKEAPSEMELEMHAQDLMKAHKIKTNKSLMGHVAKHMKKKKMHMEEMMSEMPEESSGLIEGLKAKKKKVFTAE